MNEKMMLFNNEEFGEIQIFEQDGKFEFAATESAIMLGYSNPIDAIQRHCKKDGVVKHEVGVQTGFKKDGTPAIQIVEKNFITEGNLYRLIAHSKLPNAEKFERWVFDELLPSIRKNGVYMTQDFASMALQDPLQVAKILQGLAEEQQKNKELVVQNMKLEQTVTEQKQLIETQNKDLAYLETIKGSPNAIKISQMAGDYGCSPQDMNNILVAIGFQKKVNDQWLPKGDFAGHKLTVSTTIAFDKNGKVVSGSGECVGTKMQTLVTQKGRYRIYQILKEIGIIPEVEMSDDDDSSYNLIGTLSNIGKKMMKQGMRFKTEIPQDIKEKIKVATKNFIENEKVKIELCVDEEGKKSEVMEDFYNVNCDDVRNIKARPWAYKKSKAIELYNSGYLSEVEFKSIIDKCID